MITEVNALPNGPVIVKTENSVVAICRCSNTKNDPYCDGSHKLMNYNGTQLLIKGCNLDSCAETGCCDSSPE